MYRDTLGKPANTLFRHNLTTILETAVRQSNAQYDDPDILERLDVQLLEVSLYIYIDKGDPIKLTGVY